MDGCGTPVCIPVAKVGARVDEEVDALHEQMRLRKVNAGTVTELEEAMVALGRLRQAATK